MWGPGHPQVLLTLSWGLSLIHLSATTSASPPPRSRTHVLILQGWSCSSLPLLRPAAGILGVQSLLLRHSPEELVYGQSFSAPEA